MYKLLEMVDGNVIREHTLGAPTFTIGRKPDNDLQPDDPSVSGNHAVITLVPLDYLEGAHEVIIDDRGSTNGTLVNGQRIKQQRLKHGDMVSLGASHFKLIDDQTVAMDGTRILLQDEEF